MPAYDTVVIGFSAGGIDPLLHLVAWLPADVPAAIFVVHHFPPHGVSALPSILRRRIAVPADQAVDGEPVLPGRIYVSCPDRHLMVAGGRVHLSDHPPEHGHRPAIDALFRSAASAFGPRVIGVILSGTLGDGAAGLREIKARGGLAMVQHPDEAAYSAMPEHALGGVQVDHVGPVAGLAARLAGLVASALKPEPPEPPLRTRSRVLETEADLARRLAERNGRSGYQRAAARFLSAARRAEHDLSALDAVSKAGTDSVVAAGGGESW